MLLALVLRRHLAKLHIALKQELTTEELDDDAMTIRYIISAVWNRYNILKGEFYPLVFRPCPPLNITRPLKTSGCDRYEANIRVDLLRTSECFVST
jgi:hypothetical protein